MNESISATITSLKKALHDIDVNQNRTASDSPSIFVDEKVLERPPFHYFFTLVKFIARGKPSLAWEKLFFGDGSEPQQCLSKKEKVCPNYFSITTIYAGELSFDGV